MQNKDTNKSEHKGPRSAITRWGIAYFYFAVRKLFALRTSLQNKEHWDNEFTGSFPRGSGALSAVTGGSPEDINEMPATENPNEEGPVYDGSDL